METLKLLFLVFCLVPSLTHGRHLRKLKKQQQQHQNRQQTIENVQEEEKEAKKISSSLSSLKLNNIPHRIYLAGNEIIEGFNKQLVSRNHVEMKFTYELVEPKLCEMFNPPFGCCWDNRTVALGPNGEGCPTCKNKKKSCRKWKDQCSTQLIKDTCPETCNICPKPKKTKCKDSPDQKDYCPLYARFGLCKRKQIMNYCKQSCGAC